MLAPAQTDGPAALNAEPAAAAVTPEKPLVGAVFYPSVLSLVIRGGPVVTPKNSVGRISNARLPTNASVGRKVAYQEAKVRGGVSHRASPHQRAPSLSRNWPRP